MPTPDEYAMTEDQRRELDQAIDKAAATVSQRILDRLFPQLAKPDDDQDDNTE
jgi:hypothetical protein